MNWEDARVFLAVARAGQMLGAARAAGVSQATLSRRIAALERAMDATLLLRRAHGCELTEAGRALMRRLERVEAEFRAAEGDLGAAASALSGTVRIGAPDGFGTAFLAPRLVRLAAAHPKLTVQLVPMPRNFSLSQREADLAVVVGRPETGLVVRRKLMDYTLSLYASPGYLQSAPPLTQPSDLARHRLVGYVDDLIYSPELDYAGLFHRAWASHIAVSSALGQQEVVRAGGGIGILHDYLVTPEMGVQRVLPDLRVTRSYWAVMHENQRDIRRVRVVWDFLAAVAAAG